jgi:hypothetical protein
MRDPETLFFFPLCWQACLIGSRQFFHREADRFCDQDMRLFAKRCRDNARLFVMSPSQLDFSSSTLVCCVGSIGAEGVLRQPEELPVI